MKKISLILLTSFLSITSYAQANYSVEERLKSCLESCLSFEEPGFALRKCVGVCKKDFENSQSQNKFCTSFEDLCDGDDEDDVWGGL